MKVALAFIAGVVAASWIYRADLRAADRLIVSLDAQLDSATAAVDYAHQTMDQLEGCRLRSAPESLAMHMGGRHEQ